VPATHGECYTIALLRVIIRVFALRDPCDDNVKIWLDWMQLGNLKFIEHKAIAFHYRLKEWQDTELVVYNATLEAIRATCNCVVLTCG